MTSDRPYRKSLGYREAVAELTREAGRRFDPGMVDALLGLLRAHPLSAAAVADAAPRHDERGGRFT